MLETFQRFHADGLGPFEMVVLDNSDTDELQSQVGAFAFPLRYVYSAEQLSVVENFNRGTVGIRGQFVCFMGDDDLISSRIFDLARLMEHEDIDSAIVAPSTRCIYFWPGIVDNKWGDVGGHLFLSACSGQVRLLDVTLALQDCKRHPCDGPQSLPRAYSGLVSRRVVESVIARHGALFGGCSPDIFSSRLLAGEVRRHALVDLPVLVAGAAKSSTSAARSGAFRHRRPAGE